MFNFRDVARWIVFIILFIGLFEGIDIAGKILLFIIVFLMELDSLAIRSHGRILEIMWKEYEENEKEEG